jgi:hypothetical protein
MIVFENSKSEDTLDYAELLELHFQGKLSVQYNVLYIPLPSTVDALEFTVMYVFPPDTPVRKHVPSDEACHHYWTEKAATAKFYPTTHRPCLDFSLKKECLRSSPSPWHTNYKQSTW